MELSHKLSDGYIGSDFNDMFFKYYDTTLFNTRTARDLITGYNDPLMSIANLVMPALVKEDKFSLVNGVSI